MDKSHTFHDAATVAADGTIANVKAYNSLGVYIRRTAGTSTVKFWHTVDGTNYTPLRGRAMKLSISVYIGVCDISTTGTDETWTFDVSGSKYVKMQLYEVTTGPVTVKGVAKK